MKATKSKTSTWVWLALLAVVLTTLVFSNFFRGLGDGLTDSYAAKSTVHTGR